jgi:hypothetical protein
MIVGRDGFGRGLAACALLALGATAAAAEVQPSVYAGLRAPGERSGLAAVAAPEPTARLADETASPEDGPRGKAISPALAGVLSAVVPGSGQLVMGQRRGWLYLGVETVAWFSYFALRSAGSRSEDDYQEYADLHWDWNRYETVSSCPDGGPENFEEERDILLDLYDNDRDSFYEAIGDQRVYACGWESSAARSAFLGGVDDADALFRGASYAAGAALLNHLVSAIDAARSASRRRAVSTGSLEWRVRPGPSGPVLSFAANRSF